ncbi:hypothetical protein [Nannocystis bainbridge]|uniref:Lipoprotein n=1 Tax=Nannocystis bainbridge TaxID=2995303 RepID=A0ABT5EDD0_9BACT|nr:hypothetical protein [Nannocystis bainbridge]MDC0722791.1 hypothetical protein [Nannocystis bainbridge]
MKTLHHTLGLACLLALAACGSRAKEPAPTAGAATPAGAAAPAGAPAPADTRTNPHPTGQSANSPTPGPSSGAANPSGTHPPAPGYEPPGGVAAGAKPSADDPGHHDAKAADPAK